MHDKFLGCFKIDLIELFIFLVNDLGDLNYDT